MRVDARDPAKIAQTMEYAIANEAHLKAALAEWQEGPGLERFRRSAIASVFATALDQALAAQ